MIMTDFENAMEQAQRWCEYPVIRWNERRSNWQADTGVVKLYLNAMAAAHADVVAERDSYREVARKLARYVLPDSDTLTFQQLVEIADAVCEAAEDAGRCRSGRGCLRC